MAANWLKRLFGASKPQNSENAARPSCKAQMNQLTKDAMAPRYFGDDDISYGHINERIYGAKNQLIELLVRDESDQAALFQIARTHLVPEVREAAVKNITDQKMLELFLIHDERDESVHCQSRRAAAVKNLTDQALLLSIAEKQDENYYVRETAVRKLTDQATLAGIALSLSDLDCRRTAVDALTDQALLAKVAREGGTPWLRQIAVGKISDKSLLSTIAT